MSAQSDPIRRWTLYSRSFLIRFIVNLINILRAAFAPIFFCQKITNPKCKWRKAAQSSNVRNRRALNMLMINWPLAFNLHTLTCGRIDIVWPILNTSDIFCRLGLSQECDKPLLFSYPRIWVRTYVNVCQFEIFVTFNLRCCIIRLICTSNFVSLSLPICKSNNDGMSKIEF